MENKKNNETSYKLIIVIASVIVIVAILEMAARERSPQQLFSPRMKFDLNSLWRYEGVDLWRMNEHYSDEKIRRFAASDEAFRIIGIGDSIMFGSGIPEKKTYLSRLAAEIKKRTGRKVATLDLATPGFNFEQKSALLRQKAAGLKPDLVIIHLWEDDGNKHMIVGGNLYDKTVYSSQGVVRLLPIPEKLNEFLIVNSRLYQLINFQLLRERYRANGQKTTEKELIESADRLKKSLPRDTRAIILFSPVLDKGKIKKNDMGSPQNFVYKSLKKWADRNGVETYDLGEPLSGIDGASIGLDTCHFNEKGHDMLLKILADHISKNYVAKAANK